MLRKTGFNLFCKEKRILKKWLSIAGRIKNSIKIDRIIIKKSKKCQTIKLHSIFYIKKNLDDRHT